MEPELTEVRKVSSEPPTVCSLPGRQLSTPLLPSETPSPRSSRSSRSGVSSGVSSCPTRRMVSRGMAALGPRRHTALGDSLESGQGYISESLDRLPRSGTLEVISDSPCHSQETSRRVSFADNDSDSVWSEPSRLRSTGSTSFKDNLSGLKIDDAISLCNTLAAVVLAYVCFLSVASIYGRVYRGWSVVDSIYFAVVTAHTVGYGDFTMQDDNEGDCIFAAVYVLAGVAMLGIVAGEAIVKFLESHEDRVTHHTHKHHWRWHIFFGAVEVVAPLVLGTAGFAYFEDKHWSQGLYWAVSTASTVGYGDLVPVTDEGKLFTVFYIPVSIALLVCGVASFARVPMELRRSKFLAQLTEEAFTRDVFEELASGSELQRLHLCQDEECITRNEFCLFLLNCLGKISEEDLAACQDIFTKLDRTQNGRLTFEDMEMITRDKMPEIAKDLLASFDQQFQCRPLPDVLRQRSFADVRRCRSAAPSFGHVDNDDYRFERSRRDSVASEG